MCLFMPLHHAAGYIISVNRLHASGDSHHDMLPDILRDMLPGLSFGVMLQAIGLLRWGPSGALKP